MGWRLRRVSEPELEPDLQQQSAPTAPPGPVLPISSPRPPLSAQVGWTGVGNVGYAAFQWGMLIALTKLVEPAAVGQFGLGLAISVPVFMFTNLQLRSLQATRVSQRFQFGDYLGLRIVSSLAALATIGVSVAVVGYRMQTALVVLAVALAKSLESIADTVYGHLQHHERMDRIAISMLLKGALSLVGLAAVIWATRSVFLGALAMAFASLVVLFAYDIPTAAGVSIRSGEARTRREAATPRFRRSEATAIARLGLPLGVASLLLALAANIPRYVLERSHGESALGYFAALAHPTAAFSIVVSAFGQAATPRLAEFYRTNRAAFRKTVLSLCAVPIVAASAASAVVALLGPRLLTILYRAEYAPYFDAFLLLLASGAVWSLASVLGFAVTAARRLVGQAPISLFVGAVAAALSLAVIPVYGVRGACMVSLATGAVSVVAYLALLLWRPARVTPRAAVIP
ncbi:MAG: lipopolysaccharide biosynthesis protein [Bacteroidota bacterium]